MTVLLLYLCGCDWCSKRLRGGKGLPGLCFQVSLSLSLFLVPLLLLLLPLGLHSSFFFVLYVFYIRYLEAGFAGRATAPLA